MLNVTLAEPRTHASLTVFPLVTHDAAELPYALLVDALIAGTLRVTEVGPGSVPELLATTKSDAEVLILDGEQLIGARQNRMTNRSILLPGRGETRIPVSCMEQGRWRPVGDDFSPSHVNAPSSVRRKTRESETAYAQAGAAVPIEALAQAQGSVWDAIADKAAKLGATSATGALNELQAARGHDVDLWEKLFPAVPNQVGLLAFVGNRALGMDAIGGRGLYARLHARLLRGYIADALESPDAVAEVTAVAAQSFLDIVREARRVAAPSVGRGEYAVLAGAVVGGELRNGDRLAHLSAFPDGVALGAPEVADPRHPPIPPPSRRGRRS